MSNTCHFVEATGGGVLSIILDIVKTHQDRDPRSKICILYSSRKETPDDIDRLFDNCKLIKIDLGRKLFSIKDIRTIFTLKKIFADYTVVHCHSSRAGFLGRITSFISPRTKVLYSPHCYAFLNQEFSKTKKSLIFLVEKLLAKLSRSTTIACGDSEFKLSKKLGGKTMLIRNGIKLPSSPPANSSPANRLRIIGSGRNSLQKDPDLFEEISNMTSPEIADFIWIGEHPKAEISTGWLSRDEAARTLAGGDVFLSTSLWEGLPVAGIEAMANSKPLIVRNTIGFSDLVRHAENGFLYDSASEAVEFIKELQKNQHLLRIMGQKSRLLAEELYSDKNYSKLIELYSQPPSL